jgi:hypothetical protein
MHCVYLFCDQSGGRIVAIKVVSQLQLTGRHNKSSIPYSLAALGAAEILGYTNMRFPCRQELTLGYHVIYLQNFKSVTPIKLIQPNCGEFCCLPWLTSAKFGRNALHAKAENVMRNQQKM